MRPPSTRRITPTGRAGPAAFTRPRGRKCRPSPPEGSPKTFAQGLYEGVAERRLLPARRGPGHVSLAEAGGTGGVRVSLRRRLTWWPMPAAEVTLLKADRPDLCRLLVSRDGTAWTPLCTQEQARPTARRPWTWGVGLGGKACPTSTPHTRSSSRSSCKPAGTCGEPAFRDLHRGGPPHAEQAGAARTCGRARTCWKVTADRIARGLCLELAVEYRVDGRLRRRDPVRRAAFPITSSIDVPKRTRRRSLPDVRSRLQRGTVANGGDRHASAAVGKRAGHGQAHQ